MSISPEQINQAIKAIEVQLAILKQAAGVPGAPVDEGVVGTFDGEYMVLSDGKRYQIPPNYASKSMLVPGDTIRMIEEPNGGQAKFKQIAKAERQKSTGVLARKDGKFEVLCEEGSFKVLAAAIKHYEGEVGDSVTIQFPKNHTKGSWAAVEKVIKPNAQGATPSAAAASAPAPTPIAPIASPIQHAAVPSVEPPTPVVAEAADVVPAQPSAPATAPEATAAEPPSVEAAVSQPAPARPARAESERSAKSNNDRPVRSNTPDRNRPKTTQASGGDRSERNDRPRSTDRRPSSDRPASTSRAPRTEAPAPRPRVEPEPQVLTPGDTGEISVSAVMDEDDLM